jgi:heme-degrading monooxygenase HmoA
MYSRHIMLNVKPNQREELTKTFEREILPLLQKQTGFTDEIVFQSPDNKVIAISLWETKEAADRYSREFYPQVLKSLAHFVEGTPEVRGCEVIYSTLQNTATTR